MPPPKPSDPPPPVVPGIDYQRRNDQISIDYKETPLETVAREITDITNKNVIVSFGLENKLVSGYIKNMPFESALDKFALANELTIEITKDNFYVFKSLEKEVAEMENEDKDNKTKGRIPVKVSGEFELKATSINDITLYAHDVPISDIILKVSEELELSYFINSQINGNANIFIQHTTYDELLNYIFNASQYTYEKQGDIYIIGERKIENLRTTKVIQLQHRSLENVTENIPTELSQGVNIREFPELNSLILSGSKRNIEEIELFVRQIDKPVPVVLIEVMLIDYTNDRTVSAGIKVGVAEDQQQQSGGSLYPELKYHFNSQSVNRLIDNFEGNGFLNLGRVTPNFYMSIQAMEEQGKLRVRSTPKLATLNGSEATMSIGNTEYYVNESNNVIGAQNPQNIITRQFQSVNADLKVTIRPFVSGDDQITLEISVEQSDFTGRISQDAPPGSVTRSFSSLLRVRNEEMILLGGLEQKTINDIGRGVPLLSRIPVIKWFVSDRSRTKSKSKLNIFIKPTVLY